MQFPEIKPFPREIPAFRIEQRELNRKTHIRRSELCQNGAVYKFHHRMNNAFRLYDHFNLIQCHVEEPARLHDLESFIDQRRRIDRDLRPHTPVRVLQGIFLYNIRQCFLCFAAERPA